MDAAFEQTREPRPTVLDVVRALRSDVAAATFPIEVDDASFARDSQARLLTLLDNHLLPRLTELSSPAVVVVAGSTGAGKSTLVNSLVGEELSPAGVLRPTTRQPMVLHHPDDPPGLATERLREVAETRTSEAIPRGILLVDAPDLDSLVAENRQIAEELLSAADIWLFVTTATRYGDALPWEALIRSRERNATVAMVLSRVPNASMGQVRMGLLERLREHEMTNVPLFVIPDVGPHEGLLPAETVAPIRQWLSMLGGMDQAKTVVHRTLKGSLDALPGWVDYLSRVQDEQVEAACALTAKIVETAQDAGNSARDVIGAGLVADASLASRWLEVSGAARLERIKFKRGTANPRVVRSSKRAGVRRGEALAAIKADLQTAVVRTLKTLAEQAHLELGQALTAPDAPEGAVTLWGQRQDGEARRELRAKTETREWFDAATEAVQQIKAPDSLVAAVQQAFTPAGLDTLLEAAAAGSDDARLLLNRVLGEFAARPVALLRADLADRAEAMALAEGAAIAVPIADAGLDDDRSLALRLRLAELRSL